MRNFAVLILMLILFTVIAKQTLANSVSSEWHYRVTLDGKSIGYHQFTLRTNGNKRVIESQAKFEVKFLFFKAYAYDHQATEQWTGDCLRSISTTTRDNGD